MIQRLLYPPELDPQQQRDRFDPVLEGTRYGLSRELSLAIWERVCAEATDSAGRCNTEEAQRRFHEIGARLAARGGTLQAVGRTTRVRVEILGEPFDGRGVKQLAGRMPGRDTLVAVEARQRAYLEQGSEATDLGLLSAGTEIPDASEVERAVAALQGAAQMDRAVAPTAQNRVQDHRPFALRAWVPHGRERADLEMWSPRVVGEPHVTDRPETTDPRSATMALHDRLQQTFGEDARDVAFRRDDGRAGAAEAVTIGETVFLSRVGDSETLLRVGHEVAHAIQQRRGRAAGETDATAIPSGRRASLELEAEQAGQALIGGLPFAVRGAAPSRVALFRGGHEVPATSHPTEDGAQRPHPELPPEQRREQRNERSPDQLSREHGGATAASEVGPTDAPIHRDAPAGKDTGAASAPQPHDSAHRASATGGGAVAGAGPSGGTGPGVGPGAGPTASPAPEAPALDASDPGSLLSSLEHARASSLLTTLNSVQAATPQAFQSMRTQAQTEMPRIQRPTGLPPRGDSAAARERAPEASATPREPTAMPPAPSTGPQRTPDRLVHEAPAPPPVVPTQLAGGDDHAHGHEQDHAAAQDPALTRSAQSALSGIPLGTNQVSTTATEVPTVDMHGQTDPSQMDITQAGAQRDTAAAVADARRSTTQDRGEHDIFPQADPEMLEAQLVAGGAGATPREGGAATATAPDALPSEALASIDADASPILHKKIGAEHERYTTGKAEQDAAKRAAHEQTRADIAQAETEARARQTDAQTAAGGEVTTARADWQHEIDHVDQDFRTQAIAARDQHRRGIASEQQSANRRAAEYIQTAERDADQEKRKAEADAQKKKDEGKKESGGFFGWLKRKAKALIDGIKSAVNFIYDNLRKAVKAIFEAAKKLALGVIELARKAIVGLIKAFGEILKGLVKIALAAFPQLRDRILRRIDQAVQKATQLVNSIAEGLKKVVSALIDFLAKTIDSILGLIQDLYNAALTVIGMLVTGEFAELMKKRGQVVAAARTAPGQFETAAYEELLGGDLDQPLSPAELIAAGRTPPPELVQQGAGAATEAGFANQASPADGDHASGDPAAGDHADGDEPAPQPPWTESNVGVDQVAHGEELEPELVQEIQARTGGGDGTVEFGESNDDTRSLDHMLGRTGGQGAAAQPTTDGNHADASPVAQGQDAGQQPASQVGADGLSPSDRAAVKWQLMKKGLADWWSKNWPYVLAGGVLAVAGFIIANILTGGAILAALPPIMTVVGQIMMGVAILKIVEHVRDFLQKGWNGDIRGGGKSLAKGLAAGAIELIMLLTFKVGEAAVRGARLAARGVVRGAQAAARGTARAGRAAVRCLERGAEAMARSSVRVVAAIARGAQYAIRAGKVLLRGVGQAISRGVKALREFGARLLSRSRFKGFRIRIQGKQWILEGRINPWVLLADGTVQWEKSRGHGPMGSETSVRGQQGFVLGCTKADALADMLRTNPAMRDDVLALLRRTDIDREGILRGLQKLTPDEAAVISRRLRELKEVDEAVLEQMIANYRKGTGIPKGSNSGGTVAAGKAETVPPVEGGTGASPHAQSGTPHNNPRYQYPHADEDWAAVLRNHAEQTVLGDIADNLDKAIKGLIPREQVTGTIKMTVDQAVCSACRGGLDSGSAGIIKQFTTQFPNVTVMVSAAGTSELLVVKGGRILIPR